MKSILLIGISYVIIMSHQISLMGCTTIIVGKNACVDGCPMVSYCCDGANYDIRIVKVPTANHKPGSMRPLYAKPPGNIRYPRIVDEQRSPGYAPIAGQQPTNPVAYIPQVEHTFGYFEVVMPILNEQGLGMGECTCEARTGKTGGDRKNAPFENRNLARIAMERCSTARDAITLMGEMAEKYGYNETGETITIIDTEETWVFNILCTPSGKGAIWAAQRVPDDEIAVMANIFTIRVIDLDNPDYFMASDNIFKVAEEQGWWNPATPFDFCFVYDKVRKEPPYGSLRRMWRVYSLLAPSCGFHAWVQDSYTREYPFSIKPDKKVSVQDLIAIHRDHYEGTEFDLTKGYAAGPFGTPNRYSGGKAENQIEGRWERPISVNRVSHSIVVQSRGWLPPSVGGIVWFGHDAAYSTCYVPFYAGMTEMPKPYMTGSMTKFSRESSWWAFNFVSNWADLKYSYMIKDINTAQERLENKAFEMQSSIEKVASTLHKNNPDLAVEYLTDYCINHANDVVNEWWNLADYLVVKYSDGFINQPKVGQGVGYPAWWLKRVGYKTH